MLGVKILRLSRFLLSLIILNLFTINLASALEAVSESPNLKEVPLSGSLILAIGLLLIAIFIMIRINIHRKNRSNKKKR
jgi:hypothetical protein